MLFEINSDLDMLNIPMNNNTNILDPTSALSYGNSFKDEYVGYKDYKVKRVNASSEREAMLLKIQELDFIMNDLALKLDINPKNNELYELFKKYAIDLKNLCEEYSKKYQVLEMIKDTNEMYTWLSNPWPWDGGRRYV